ncbi:MAG: M23 family metallopeptidase [Prolixibacteraceae bacterium]|jgi:murein DD-endopeptidase MepM/ murein hydrolase activator NlpD|nr:M23 family metallopeptidase [Prolixibacteraceae bacterium]MBT6007187.1 M23 family metallopeptidase [Prolixibacteraceae bacterium]MBT6764252.1 M23 family metallopeptidase [Prolixibacteraceae bacterium]MBT6998728.1 M23 family metallopeptidase [Prolixibacteraceae bacterium]MBT7397550.1 M23 family metallopeptidase [Prolixibacteraceae bacterium]
MPKRKYKFNQDNLSYERVGISLKERFTKILAYFLSSLALSIIIVVVFINTYETPKTKALKRENQRLLSQYELIAKDLDKVGNVLAELQQRDDNIYRVIFESDPIPSSVRMGGFGGSNKYSHLESLDNAALVIETARKLDIVAKEAYIQSKSYDEVMKMALNKENMLASIPAIMPISNKDLKRTASGWGVRLHPIYKVRKMHYGMDFTSPIGTPIYATGDGKVVEVKGSKRSRVGFGLVIKIDHGFGYETVYGHLNAFNVKQRQKVKRGDIIGYVGNSGGSTAPHLHYEVHKNGNPVNPSYYYYKDLSPQEYDKMIAISSNIGQTLD